MRDFVIACSSLIFVTILFCSASGGRGMVKFEIVSNVRLGMPVIFFCANRSARTSVDCTAISKNGDNRISTGRAKATAWFVLAGKASALTIADRPRLPAIVINKSPSFKIERDSSSQWTCSRIYLQFSIFNCPSDVTFSARIYVTPFGEYDLLPPLGVVPLLITSQRLLSFTHSHESGMSNGGSIL